MLHLSSVLQPGGNQNDSHELCVWLLDRLSQELSLKLPTRLSEAPGRPKASHNNSDENAQPPATITSSFVEELFQIEFKSTVICSKCHYQSSKFENDMMLSLPLPQNQVRSLSLISNFSPLCPKSTIPDVLVLPRFATPSQCCNVSGGLCTHI